MPGAPSFDTTRCERSPAPFEVPPESTTRSQRSQRRAHGDVRARPRRPETAPNGNRLAARFRNRRRDDRPVAVIDLRRRQRCARRDELVAGREHRHLGPAHDIDLGDAAGRQHADLARCRCACRAAAPARRARCRSPHRRRTGPARDARRTSIAGTDRSSTSSVCSIITTASAPRGTTPPVAIVVAEPGSDLERRRMPAHDHLAVETKPARRDGRSAPAVSAARSAKPSTLARSNGGTSIGAITSCASTRPSAVRERDRLARQRRQIDVPEEARAAPPRPRPLRGTAPGARRGGSAAIRSRARPIPVRNARSWPRSYHDLAVRRISFALRRARKSIRWPAPAPRAAHSPRLWGWRADRRSAPERARRAPPARTLCA